MPRALLVAALFVVPAAADGPLVVLAPRSLHPTLADFVAYKKTVLPTELVALETAVAGPGADDPEKIKRHLYGLWKAGKLASLLLVGDADTMPVRYMCLDRATPAAFDVAFYPSDLYYADLATADGAFEDWNGRRDGHHAGYFGEVRGEKNKEGPINADRIHYLPEIAVGRWPASTPAAVARIAAKSVAYEKAVRAGTHPGLGKAAFVVAGGWVDARRAFDANAAALGDRWQSSKLHYGTKAPPTEKSLYGLLERGAGLVLHAGHGASNGWDQCCSQPGLLKTKNADRLPILLSAGCSTAYFAPLPPYGPYTDIHGADHRGTDAGEVFTAPPPPPAPIQKKHNPSGLGEAALANGPNGAVAYVGCNTGSQPCGLTLLAGFCKSVGKRPDVRLGDAWADAIRHYHAKERLDALRPTADWYPPSVYFQGMKFMLFGDPTLPLPVALLPKRQAE